MDLVKVANGLDWIGMDWNTTSTSYSFFTTSPMSKCANYMRK